MAMFAELSIKGSKGKGVASQFLHCLLGCWLVGWLAGWLLARQRVSTASICPAKGPPAPRMCIQRQVTVGDILNRVHVTWHRWLCAAGCQLGQSTL